MFAVYVSLTPFIILNVFLYSVWKVYHKWVLNFIKCFFLIYSIDFLLYSLRDSGGVLRYILASSIIDNKIREKRSRLNNELLSFHMNLEVFIKGLTMSLHLAMGFQNKKGPYGTDQFSLKLRSFLKMSKRSKAVSYKPFQIEKSKKKQNKILKICVPELLC